MFKTVSTLAGALALAVLSGTALSGTAQAANSTGLQQVSSFSTNHDSASPVTAPGHNRYDPYGMNPPTAGKVYTDGHYGSAAASAGVHNRYTN